MPRPHVQVVLGHESLPIGLEAAIQRVGATASFRSMEDFAKNGVAPAADAVVVIAPPIGGASAEARLGAVYRRVSDQPRATLVLGAGTRPNSAPRGAPLTFGGTLSEEELTGRLETMIAMRESLDWLGRTRTERKEDALARQYLAQLRQVSETQRQFIPRLPKYGDLSFEAVFRPVEPVSGDMYDVYPIDSEHLGIAVVDSEGHGLPAALLTIFIKRAIRGGDAGQRRGLVQPDEVLRRLNAELIEAEFSECQFVAAVYAVLNTRTRRIELARGGAPYPVLRRATGEVELLRGAGCVVGVIPDAEFETISLDLNPGDDLILYTDGLERVVMVPENETRAVAPKPRGVWNRMMDAMSSHAAPELSPDESLLGAGWMQELSENGLSEAFSHLTARQETLRRVGYPLDDLTALAIRRASAEAAVA